MAVISLRVIAPSGAAIGTGSDQSAIALTAGATGTAEFFGTGNIPPVGSSDGSDGINAAVATALQTASNMNLPSDSEAFALIDKGNGTASRGLGGSATIDYDENGTVTLKNCPANASFLLYYQYNAAHSGDLVGDDSAAANMICTIRARSLMSGVEARLRVTMYN